MELKTNNSGKKYFSVLSDGKFHQSVPDGTPNAIKREIKDKQTGMITQIKTELVFDEIVGKITNISFDDSDFGKIIKIEIDKTGVISLNTASNFGTDLMKKLVGMDLSLAYSFKPYSFTDDKGKSRKGISVYQGENKIESFYWNPITKKATNNFPEPEGDISSFDSDDWKMYFTKVKKFLISEVEKLVIKSDNVDDSSIEYPEEDITPEDIPF